MYDNESWTWKSIKNREGKKLQNQSNVVQNAAAKQTRKVGTDFVTIATPLLPFSGDPGMPETPPVGRIHVRINGVFWFYNRLWCWYNTFQYQLH